MENSSKAWPRPGRPPSLLAEEATARCLLAGGRAKGRRLRLQRLRLLSLPPANAFVRRLQHRSASREHTARSLDDGRPLTERSLRAGDGADGSSPAPHRAGGASPQPALTPRPGGSPVSGDPTLSPPRDADLALTGSESARGGGNGGWRNASVRDINPDFLRDSPRGFSDADALPYDATLAVTPRLTPRQGQASGGPGAFPASLVMTPRGASAASRLTPAGL